LIFVGQSKPAAALYLALKEKGSAASFMATSVVSGIYSEIGAKAHGIIVSQVIPSPYVRYVSKLVDDYRSHVQASGAPNFSHTSLEGYLIARMATKAIENSGATPNRDKFASSLVAMKNTDFGGYKISYAEGDHGGSDFVEINMIRGNGTFVR
jgi:branched-chain amino acid transport system substrate-binding protein